MGVVADSVSVDEVITFRLAAHGLIERLSEDELLSAAGRCGIQNSPPGSALLALHARVRGITADTLAAAIEDKSLVQSWAMRGAPYFFPTADFSVFTTGVLPTTENALRHFIPGVQQSIDRLDMSVTDAVELCHNEIGDVLAGRRLAINQLGAELAHRISGDLTTKQRSVWNSEGPYARGQPVGEAVVHFCIRILALRQVVCLAPRENNTAPFVLVGDWLDRPTPDPDAPAARAELLRRYLRCYGPSTPGNFAAWLGLAAGDVGPWWDLVAQELPVSNSAVRHGYSSTTSTRYAHPRLPKVCGYCRPTTPIPTCATATQSSTDLTIARYGKRAAHPAPC